MLLCFTVLLYFPKNLIALSYVILRGKIEVKLWFVPRRTCDVSRVFPRLILSHSSGMALEMTMAVGCLVHHFGPDWIISTTIGRIAATFATDIQIG